MNGNPSSQSSNLFTHYVGTRISALDSQAGWIDPIPITCCWYVLSKGTVLNLIFFHLWIEKKARACLLGCLNDPKGIYDTYYIIVSNCPTVCQWWWMFLMKKGQCHTPELCCLSVRPVTLSYQTKMAPATLKEQCLSFLHLKVCDKLNVVTHPCNSSPGAA